MMSDINSKSIGLSQFKTETPVEKTAKRENFFMQSKEIKISDPAKHCSHFGKEITHCGMVTAKPAR